MLDVRTTIESAFFPQTIVPLESRPLVISKCGTDLAFEVEEFYPIESTTVFRSLIKVWRPFVVESGEDRTIDMEDEEWGGRAQRFALSKSGRTKW